MRTRRDALALASLFVALGVTGIACAADVAAAALPGPDARVPRLIGIQFIGRTVSDLDRSVAFYKALGFEQDPLAKPDWRERDEISEQLYSTSGFRTRMAKMFTMNAASGRRFVVYLREIKGIPQVSHAGHAAWDPGAAGLGLIVADAPAVWERLRAAGLLQARNIRSELVAPPNAPGEWLGFITDPDGLDIGIVQARSAGNGRGALQIGVNNVSLVIKDPAKAKAFYGDTLGGQVVAAEPKWYSGAYYDASTGGSGNEMRVFMARFPESLSPENHRITCQLVEYRKPESKVTPRKITDIGVSYVGIELQNLKSWVEKAVANGARRISDRPIVTMRSGTREVMLQDPDVGGFVLLFEQP
jgi:catechol 2,3-dioxygenase-like lactoylglutathione lyase family enzyme